MLFTLRFTLSCTELVINKKFLYFHLESPHIASFLLVFDSASQSIHIPLTCGSEFWQSIGAAFGSLLFRLGIREAVSEGQKTGSFNTQPRNQSKKIMRLFYRCYLL